MKYFLILLCSGLALVAWSETSKRNVSMETADSTPDTPNGKIAKSDEEWREILTPAQYEILREAGTEAPNGKIYQEFKQQGGGTYYCAGCDAELFSSNEKFDSGCGWPSLYDPANAKNVRTDTDYKLGYARTEVVCNVCDGHLGHVFTGEGFDTPTDKRYCINGVALKFVPASEEPDQAGKQETGTSTPADEG